MTPKEAIYVLEKNKPTTDPRMCGVVLCRAVDIAIDALEKQDKYKWHNLRKNPDDLPKVGECVVTKLILNSGKTSYCIDMPLDERGLELMKTGLNGYFHVLAWCYREPFEEDNE